MQQSVKLHHLVESHNSITVSVCERKGKFCYFIPMCYSHRPSESNSVFGFSDHLYQLSCMCIVLIHLLRKRNLRSIHHYKETHFIEVELAWQTKYTHKVHNLVDYDICVYSQEYQHHQAVKKIYSLQLSRVHLSFLTLCLPHTQAIMCLYSVTTG